MENEVILYTICLNNISATYTILACSKIRKRAGCTERKETQLNYSKIVKEYYKLKCMALCMLHSLLEKYIFLCLVRQRLYLRTKSS